MRKHTYTCNKGYAPEYKGREISWDVPETVEEAIASGEFPDEKSIVRNAVAQLNIRKGHAIQAATVEQTKDENGKETGVLARPNMTLADMEEIARSTKATSGEARIKGQGQKEKAKKFATAESKAKDILANATPEKVETLVELGLITREEGDAKLAELGNGAKSSRRTR